MVADLISQADLRHQESRRAFAQETRRLENEWQLEVQCRQENQQRQHLEALRQLGVDLTSFLTQSRADRVIELRSDGRYHVHLDPISGDAKKPDEQPSLGPE